MDATDRFEQLATSFFEFFPQLAGQVRFTHRWGGIIAGARNLVRVARSHVGFTGPLPRLAHAYAVSVMEELRDATKEESLVPIVGPEMAAAACQRGNPQGL